MMKTQKESNHAPFTSQLLNQRGGKTMPALEVKCTVSDCFFHAKGNFCGAEKIEIDMESITNKKERSEFASDFDLQAPKQKEAKSSSDTCCKTFICKKDAEKRH
ncbi:DUF1540 domain-containing protein [Solibacillus sp. FSL R5-0449]|uniref:DUF1540 domain-containing protein n=1 Tax=Solibacillus sp. FSL R5-0449 TaxID=2921639 RepID=UPI0030CE61FE